MLRFRMHELFEGAHGFAVFDEESDTRAFLLGRFVADFDGQEDVYLAEIAKAEAGEPTKIYNHFIMAYLYPDYVVLEDFSDPFPGEPVFEGPPDCTRLSLAETKQLILDWVAARKQWFRARQGSASAPTK